MGAIFDILGRLRIDKGDADKTFAGLQASGDKLKDSLGDIPIGVDDKEAEKAVSTQIRSIVEWKKQLVDLKAQRDKAEDSTTLIALNKQITTAEDEVKKLKAPVREAFDPKPVHEFEEEVKKVPGLGASIKNAFGGLKGDIVKGIGIGSGISVVEGVKSLFGDVKGAALDFDTNIRNVGSLGVKNFDEIGDELLVLSKRIPKDAGDLANATYQAISAGTDPKKSVAFVEQAAKAAVAGGATTEQAVNGLTNVLNAYKLKTEETGKVSDQIFGAIKLGKTTFNEMNAAMSNVVPIAASVGVGFDQVAATLANMTSLGVPTAQASTQVRQALVELQKPGKDLEVIMKKAGVSVEDLKNPAIGFNGVMQKIAETAAKNGKSVVQVFSSVEAGSAALLATGDNAERANKTLEDLRGATGSAGDAFDVMSKSNANLMQIGKNWINSFLAPAANGVLGFATSMGPAVTGIGSISKAIPIAAIATKGWSSATSALTSIMAASNPVILGIVGAIAIAGVAYALFAKQSKDLEGATKDVATAQKEFDDAVAKDNKTKEAAGHVRKLADEYDKLKNSGAKEDQKRLADVTKELDEAAQGAGVSVNIYGQAVSVNTDSVRKFADEQERMSGALKNAAFQNLINQGNALVDTLHDTSKEMEKVQKVANSEESGIGLLDGAKALLSSLTGAEGVAKSIAESSVQGSKDARGELSKFSQEHTDAQNKLLGIVREIDASKDHQATAEDVIAKLTSLSRAEALQYLATIHQEAAASAAATTAENKKTAAKAATKASEENLLEAAKKNAEIASQKLELELHQKALAEGRTLTAREELAIAEKFRDTLKAQIDDKKLLSLKKYSVDAEIAVKQSDIKVGDLQLKINVDRQKLLDDIAVAKIETAKSEIEVGLRPKFDLLSVIGEQIDAVRTQLEKAQLDLVDPDKADAAAMKIEQLRQKLAGLRGEQQQAAKEIADANAELNKKTVEATIDVVGYTKAQVLGLFNSLTTSRSKLSQDQLNDQRSKYDADRIALEEQLKTGKVSREAYADEVKKIEADRAKFEAENDDSLRARLAAGFESTLAQAKSAIDKEVQEFIAGQLVKELENALTQESMTASTVAGTTARIGLQQQEQLSDQVTTQASLIGAVAKIIGVWSGVGPLGWAAGLASAATMEAAFWGIAQGIRAIGFRDGGFVGLVGEEAPEIIGPAKDFSQFAAATIIATANAVERGLTERQGTRGGRQDVNVTLSGEAISSGRVIRTTLDREEFMSSKERFVRA